MDDGAFLLVAPLHASLLHDTSQPLGIHCAGLKQAARLLRPKGAIDNSTAKQLGNIDTCYSVSRHCTPVFCKQFHERTRGLHIPDSMAEPGQRRADDTVAHPAHAGCARGVTVLPPADASAAAPDLSLREERPLQLDDSVAIGRYSDLFLEEEDLLNDGEHVLVTYHMKPMPEHDYLAVAASLAGLSGRRALPCSTGAPRVFYVDPENERMKVAYPKLLVGPNAKDARAQLCFLLGLGSGNIQDIEGVLLCKIADICFPSEYLRTFKGSDCIIDMCRSIHSTPTCISADAIMGRHVRQS